MSKAQSARRHVPLEQDISTAGGRLRTKSITGKRKSRDHEFDAGNGVMDAKPSRKILALAQDLENEDNADRIASAKARQPNPAFLFDSRFGQGNDLDVGVENVVAQEDYDDAEDWEPEEEEGGADLSADDEGVDPAEQAIFARFHKSSNERDTDFASSLNKLAFNGHENGARRAASPTEDEEGQGTNLADLILQRIAEKEAQEAAAGTGQGQRKIMGDGPPEDAVEIPARIVETFSKVGQLLTRYKSGPLPKPFKVLPTLPQWPELLAITQPERWTPHAIYRATKIFISAPAATGQHFCETVLLDRVREDIRETRKLNVHLYNALKAAFYRPAAFFKGFLFPLVESACTLREAHIVSSVLAKIKIPVLHSAAALLRLCEISAEQTSSINSEAAGSANIFIRILLGKKYALPYKVVDGLVFHFLRFRGSKEEEGLAGKESKLPVLWHQSLLIFAQTYRNEITEDQREALLDLLLVRGHREIGPEVRRELLAGRNRGMGNAGNADGMDGMIVDSGEGRDDGDDTMDIA